jgi:hypothetical protein
VIVGRGGRVLVSMRVRMRASVGGSTDYRVLTFVPSPSSYNTSHSNKAGTPFDVLADSQ